MGNYLDSTYAAIDGVLLSYMGNDIALSIPNKLANMPIRQIGSGAFMELPKIQQVIIPRGVEKVGKESFKGCGDLMNVFLPGTVDTVEEQAFSLCPKLVNINYYDLEVSRHRYEIIKSSSTKFGGGKLLTHIFPEIRHIRDAVIATGVKPANMVQSGIEKLFTSQSLNEEKGRMSLTRNLSCFDFCEDTSYSIEEDAFNELIDSKRDISIDRISEQSNDQFLRIDKIPPVQKTAVFSFDDEKTKQKNGRFYLSANIRIGYHFWQSKVPVLYNNTLYFIYRRHYLSSETNLNYIRKDVAIFKGHKLVMSREEAQTVYAKYRLLTLL